MKTFEIPFDMVENFSTSSRVKSCSRLNLLNLARWVRGERRMLTNFNVQQGSVWTGCSSWALAKTVKQNLSWVLELQLHNHSSTQFFCYLSEILFPNYLCSRKFEKKLKGFHSKVPLHSNPTTSSQVFNFLLRLFFRFFLFTDDDSWTFLLRSPPHPWLCRQFDTWKELKESFSTSESSLLFYDAF